MTSPQKKGSEEAKRAAQLLSSIVNNFGPEDDIKVFVDEVLKQHRTLQQGIFKVIVTLIVAWANLPENNYDGRNEYTVKTCKQILDLFRDELVVIRDKPCIPFT